MANREVATDGTAASHAKHISIQSICDVLFSIDCSYIAKFELLVQTRVADRRNRVRTVVIFLQDLEELKRTKYKINGTAATTAIEKSNPIRPAKYPIA